jgi:hypothetical protein
MLIKDVQPIAPLLTVTCSTSEATEPQAGAGSLFSENRARHSQDPQPGRVIEQGRGDHMLDAALVLEGAANLEQCAVQERRAVRDGRLLLTMD